ncbi:morn repeat incomplete domain containing protein [Pandoravirus celtis]|uniref:Morn repeat incomplete domain containing protein n=1 Tax=Pandoravirus celtis TaxID=2568002 RepID=A0A4D6EIM7_9VIRU|nr:morn repeat incomplete domain containing protein [Pandoravirus celtis]
MDGQPHGFGLSVDQTSQVCDGHLRARLATGGRANNTSLPGRFQGQWTRGAMHGPGLTIDRDGTRVESHWDSGVRRDHVVITYGTATATRARQSRACLTARGRKRLPMASNTKAHGSGASLMARDHKWPNGDLCVGRWYSGKLHTGAYIWPNGQRYDGEFTDGRLHGRGSCTHVDGNHYDGEWVRGEKHGHGVMTYAGGHKYEGTWAHNQRDGHGIYTWTDGGAYEATIAKTDVKAGARVPMPTVRSLQASGMTPHARKIQLLAIGRTATMFSAQSVPGVHCAAAGMSARRRIVMMPGPPSFFFICMFPLKSMGRPRGRPSNRAHPVPIFHWRPLRLCFFLWSSRGGVHEKKGLGKKRQRPLSREQ